MKVLSCFAGIGGFDLGFERAGMETVAHVEIDNYASQVFARHFPNSKHYEDITKFDATPYRGVDIVCGGFPCQDLSVAGKRKGLAGGRSGLFWELVRVIRETKPRYFVLENVPGLLSSNKGRDMGTVIGALAELGYGISWRVLDSQYFGVAQRRRRVFIVGSLGTGSSAEILFEPESLCRDTPPRREAREDITELAGTLASSGGGLNRPSRSGNQADFCIVGTLSAHARGKPQNGNEVDYQTCVAFGWNKSTKQTMRVCETTDALQASPASNPAVLIDEAAFNQGENGAYTPIISQDGVCMALRNNRPHAVPQQPTVRRLTPRECERLQGFPDDWTEGHSDTQRYKMLGNAVTVNVAEWIGRKIMEAV